MVRPERHTLLFVFRSSAIEKRKRRKELQRLDADFLFTLKFDEDGNWKIVKTHQMSEKELEEEQ